MRPERETEHLLRLGGSSNVTLRSDASFSVGAHSTDPSLGLCEVEDWSDLELALPWSGWYTIVEDL